MATGNTLPPQLRSRSVTTLAASSLAKTDGSITALPPGRLHKLGNPDPFWDVGSPWTGPELTGYSARVSQWTKTLQVYLTGEDSSGTGCTVFVLHLSPALTPEETRMAVSTYTMLLNMQRTEAK